MQLDLGMIARLGAEVGLIVRDIPPDEVRLVLQPDLALIFRNLPESSDCVIGFDGLARGSQMRGRDARHTRQEG